MKHQTPRLSTNANGVTITTMEHRAGWDATFSAPKSFSVTALVGGDRGIIDDHNASVHRALEEFERYAQARVPTQKGPQVDGNRAENDRPAVDAGVSARQRPARQMPTPRRNCTPTSSCST